MNFPSENTNVGARKPSRAAFKVEKKNTCPWATDASQAVEKHSMPKAVASTCPWATSEVKENVIVQKRTPAPWDAQQSGAGFGGSMKKKGPKPITSLWENNDEATASRFQRQTYVDHSASVTAIAASNKQARNQNGIGKRSEGIF